MSDLYLEKISELQTKKEKLIKQREKVNMDIKKVDDRIKDYENLMKIQSFDATVTILKEHGISLDALIKKVELGQISRESDEGL